MSYSVVPKYFTQETLEYINSLIEAFEPKLTAYAKQLLWWNQKVNLLSRNTDLSTVEKHIVHSLLIASVGSFAREKVLVDIGSGGGLPGIPLAICFPEKKFLLLDRVSRKCAAMNDMAGKLGLKNVEVVNDDLKMFHVKHDSFGWMSKHAVKLDDFYKATAHQPKAKAYFLKGDDFREELDELTNDVKVHEYPIDEYLTDPFYSGKRVLMLELPS
ncbi:MAG: 16S rRNA (guanine(527)-N(7))-methyltransferase RsmG [Balneolia bacterium]|nr:16S rRNA (guanine(527)-N(7))-methyltransferase RsmG [Balneolia bacterium]